MDQSAVVTLFQKCVEAVEKKVFIEQVSASDKEFHFQNWVKGRIEGTGYKFDEGGRNSYPDFTMVEQTEGFEVKGLAEPGREANYDANSQVPSGYHNGRTIFYVFGRYPKQPDGNKYPVVDLVICHGDFLNADHDYVHQNKNVKGFGTYGDIMIRDRKMYVVPTPYAIAEGLAYHQTLILPAGFSVPKSLQKVGELIRQEAEELVIRYAFDLQTNILTPETIPNPNAGKLHIFYAWRTPNAPDEPVILR